MVASARVAGLLTLACASACLDLGESSDEGTSGGGGGGKGGGVASGGTWVGTGGGFDAATDSAAESATDAETGAGAASAIGCSDGTREGYLDLKAEPAVAACAGAFSVPGVVSTGSMTPKCNRTAGNTSLTNKPGTNCSVADLCALGWRVCADAKDLETHLALGASGSCPKDAAGEHFFATRQRMTDKVLCTVNAGEDNNVVGCGIGTWMDPVALDKGCGLLDSMLKCGACGGGWTCGGDCNVDGYSEGSLATNVSETSGVLCCKE